MELYHNAISVCAQKVRLVLAAKSLRPVMYHLDLRAGDAHTDAYLKLNPNGVVPTLVDGGRAIIESSVICEYLDDAYPAIPLRPADPYQRARMRLWTMKPDAGLHKACGMTSFAIAFRHQTPQRQLAAIRDPARQKMMMDLVEQGLALPGIGAFVRQFAALIPEIDAALANGPWLAGEDYSLADAAMLPYVQRLQHLGLDFLWQSSPAVADWLRRQQQQAHYSAVADYVGESYLTNVRAWGEEVLEQVRELLK